MRCFTSAIQLRAEVVYPMKVNSSTCTWVNSQISGCLKRSITMRDRSKNRKPLQKGRSLTIEAIQTVQALKRAAKQSEESLEQVFENKFGRLLKFDMTAVLCELLRQDQCLLALKVFENVKTEDWYVPRLSMYAKILAVLGSNGLLENVEQLIMELKAESILEPDLEGFNALLESLMKFNLTGLTMECFRLMKSLSCDPDRLSFKILINGLKSNGEMDLLAVVQQEAQKYYGHNINFLEADEAEMGLECK